jgi:diaminohydroxyphosphoribosylaminopyrimidine deaminase/5-amino-6-(5-phosphoribosylamino)uracil reductase
VVAAIEEPKPEGAGAGHARLRAAGIAVDVGLGAEEARHAHAGHIRRMRDGRPNVALKLAVSADGKAGAAGRKPLAITGDAAREHVHLLRAQNDAILIGSGTALADDPVLTCRLPGMEVYSPVRVVLDSVLRLPPGSRLLRSVAEVPLWVVATNDAPSAAKLALEAAGATVLAVARAGKGLDLAAVLRLLAERGITRLMVEGGPMIAAALLSADLVDEAALFRSDMIVGADGIDALEGLPLTALTHSPRLTKVAGEAVGADRVEIFERR